MQEHKVEEHKVEEHKVEEHKIEKYKVAGGLNGPVNGSLAPNFGPSE